MNRYEVKILLPQATDPVVIDYYEKTFTEQFGVPPKFHYITFGADDFRTNWCRLVFCEQIPVVVFMQCHKEEVHGASREFLRLNQDTNFSFEDLQEDIRGNHIYKIKLICK